MDSLKYVIVRGEMGIETPIVFPGFINHADVTRNCAPISAGFCAPYEDDNGQFSCWGSSVTLKLDSRGDEDAKIINEFFKPRV